MQPVPNQSASPEQKPLVRVQRLWEKYSVIIAFFILLLAAAVVNENFFTSGNLMNILRQVAIIGIISLGQTIVILSGGLDLSVGASLALSGAVGITLMNETGSVLSGVIGTLVCAVLIGVLNGTMVTKGKIAPFIATLGMMAAARSIGLYFADGGSTTGKVEGFTQIANGELLGIAYPVYFFLLLTVLLVIVLKKTRTGRYLYAIGSNERAALLSAIPVNRVKLAAYSLCGFLVGCSALIESSRLNSISSSSSGISYELDAIAAVVIGGTRLSGGKGSIVGTLFGVLILGILNNMINLMNVSPYLQGLVKGCIIVIAVLLQKKE
ncbi:ABC transporter permease [Brevibacillus fulvus]|uniref:Ribose transport system permease protein n=1 Tax=Brevibacillus fulvus TaxID=1125967 RepID=A0A939BND7_9BACL|nr:ABC transporter permease [Brevibacillus fulvus]MBM7588885.1 ribose transport system permease protein [Brevibacillus fulvus]